MSWPHKTWIAGELVTAANGNSYWRDCDNDLRAGAIALASAAAGDFVTVTSGTQLGRVPGVGPTFWTPVLGGSGGTSGQTYTRQAGRYTKVDRHVKAVFDIILSAKGTITGNVEIQGLPFTIENQGRVPLTISFFTALGGTAYFMGGYGVPNTTTALIHKQDALDGIMDVIGTSFISNTTELVGRIEYIATV